MRLPERPGARQMAYRFESLDYPATERRFNSYYAEFFPAAREALRPHAHPGVEFIYALAGTLSVHIGGDEHALEAAIRCTSIRACRTATGAAAAGSAAPSSSRRVDLPARPVPFDDGPGAPGGATSTGGEPLQRKGSLGTLMRHGNSRVRWDASAVELPAALTDAEIVGRVRAGDSALFEILMRRHNQRVYRVVRAS